ncbi:MAG TPA: fibronectin type III domain-containing protein, partial [Magnetospirillaceae bacterium]|nr:fibronectin type III domain-containing protein [Magnetospirillaceae bacterium]
SAPGEYHGTDADQGRSPLDVGNVTSVTLTGLRNGRLYYFAVTSYDAVLPRRPGEFSREVSARPSRTAP